jgi:hypothetical protein
MLTGIIGILGFLIAFSLRCLNWFVYKLNNKIILNDHTLTFIMSISIGLILFHLVQTYNVEIVAYIDAINLM